MDVILYNDHERHNRQKFYIKIYIMIVNEINIGNKFTMRVNFNLIKKGGENEKRQIWLTTTIKKKRARIYTGLRIEQCFWSQTPRSKVGGRALEDGNFSVIQKKENIRINNELRRFLVTVEIMQQLFQNQT